MSTPVPEAALGQHIAVLGKTGSGKTYTVRGIVENLLDRGARVCVIDPTGVWYGLRTLADGKRPGYPVAIFGGSHGDFPLAGNHGEEIAEIVGTSSTPAIIDTSLLRTGERVKLFTDLAEGLLRKNRRPLHLVIDEAHLFAPQGRVADPQSGQMLHAANNLVSLGRSRGLRIVLITQRPAKLHKDSLTQVETLVALRLIAPQDRRAVEEWIHDNADGAQGKAVLSSLASLKTGTGWLWAPELGLLERVAFPKIRTLDSGRAPDGSEIEGRVLAEIDRNAIATRLKAVAQEAIDNDPKRLRARIAELERQAKQQPAVIDERRIRETFNDGFSKGYAAGLKDAERSVLDAFRSQLQPVISSSIGLLSNKPAPAEPGKPAPTTVTIHARGEVAPATRRAIADMASAAVKASRSPPAANAGARDGLSGPECRILDAIAWLESTTGTDTHNQVSVAFLAGYTYGGGAFNNPRGRLNTAGLVEYVSGEKIKLTAAGREVATYPADALTTDELHKRVIERLPGPEQRILRPLLEAYPDVLPGEAVAKAAGYTYGAGAFNNPRGRLKSLGLIEYRGQGQLVASDALFPGGAA